MNAIGFKRYEKDRVPMRGMPRHFKVGRVEGNWALYEAEKARISAIAKDSVEYERLIRKLCRELGL
jgi:hypothetical protein